MRPLRSANPTCPPHLLTPPEVEGASGSRQTNSLPSRLTSRSSKGRGSGWLPGLPGPSPRAELLPPLSGERERILRGRISPGPLLPASASFKVASLKSCFPLTDKKRGERGEREGRSTDVNYRAMRRGSPTEPIAMATLSGYGPLWEGARRTTETHRGEERRVWASALCVSGGVLCADALGPPPLAAAERVRSSHPFRSGGHFPVFFPTPTPPHLHHASPSPSSPTRQEAVRRAPVGLGIRRRCV